MVLCSTYDVTVERVHCECGTNGGVPIVASSGTVRDVLYADMTVVGTNQVICVLVFHLSYVQCEEGGLQGAGMKISEAYENVTGEVRNITWRNVTIIEPRYAAMYINVFQVTYVMPLVQLKSCLQCAFFLSYYHACRKMRATVSQHIRIMLADRIGLQLQILAFR